MNKALTPQVFELRNRRGSRARVSTTGCALMSLEIVGDGATPTDVVLGYDGPGHYCQDVFYLGVVVGRVAGRIARGELHLDRQDYQLPVPATGHHLHGGDAGLGRQVWQLSYSGEQQIAFRYESPDGEGGYPGKLVTTVEYRLTDDNEFLVHYHAAADRDTVYSPTQHSYFNLAGHAGGSILDHELTVDATQFVPIDDEYIPLGGPAAVRGTAMDFTRPAALRDRIDSDEQVARAGGFDHSFVLPEDRDWRQQPAAIVREPQSGHQLTLYTDRPALHFYSGNMTGVDITGKQGATYGHRQGFCLETQHVPTRQFDAEAPAVRVGPGNDFSSETRFAFSGF